jgi:hypothetical protein
MAAINHINAVSKTRLWTGRVMSTISVLFLVFDSVAKLMMIPPVIEGTKRLGYPEYLIPVIAIILLFCTILYIIPRTSILGAVLLTGYLGGAVASNLRIESPLFSNTLFPVYFGILVWGGLFLRDKRLSAFIPVQKTIKT